MPRHEPFEPINVDAWVISPSQLNDYMNCEFMWLARNYMGKRDATNHHMARGSAWHWAAEDLWRYRMGVEEDVEPYPDDWPFSHDVCVFPEGADPDTEFAKHFRAWAHECFDKRWEAQRKRVQVGVEDYDTLYDHSLRSFLHYVNEVILRVEASVSKGKSYEDSFRYARPWKREQRMYSRDGTEVGIVDAVEKQGDDAVLIDYKTSTPFRYIVDGDYKRQLRFYAWLHGENHGVLPDAAGIHYVLHGLRIMMPVVPEEIASVIDEVEAMRDGIKSGVFRKNTDYQWCKNCSLASLGVCDRGDPVTVDVVNGEVPPGAVS